MKLIMIISVTEADSAVTRKTLKTETTITRAIKTSLFPHQRLHRSLPVTITVFFCSIAEKWESFDQEQNNHQIRSSQTDINTHHVQLFLSRSDSELRSAPPLDTSAICRSGGVSLRNTSNVDIKISPLYKNLWRPRFYFYLEYNYVYLSAG